MDDAEFWDAIFANGIERIDCPDMASWSREVGIPEIAEMYVAAAGQVALDPLFANHIVVWSPLMRLPERVI